MPWQRISHHLLLILINQLLIITFWMESSIHSHFSPNVAQICNTAGWKHLLAEKLFNMSWSRLMDTQSACNDLVCHNSASLIWMVCSHLITVNFQEIILVYSSFPLPFVERPQSVLHMRRLGYMYINSMSKVWKTLHASQNPSSWFQSSICLYSRVRFCSSEIVTVCGGMSACQMWHQYIPS